MGLSVAEQTGFAAAVERDGFAVTPPVVPQLEVDRVLAELAPLAADGRGGVRNLLDASPAVRVVPGSHRAGRLSAAAPAHRRVVHIEFPAEELAAPLEWHSRVA